MSGETGPGDRDRDAAREIADYLREQRERQEDEQVLRARRRGMLFAAGTAAVLILALLIGLAAGTI